MYKDDSDKQNMVTVLAAVFIHAKLSSGLPVGLSMDQLAASSVQLALSLIKAVEEA